MRAFFGELTGNPVTCAKVENNETSFLGTSEKLGKKMAATKGLGMALDLETSVSGIQIKSQKRKHKSKNKI